MTLTPGASPKSSGRSSEPLLWPTGRVMQAPAEPAANPVEEARLAQKRQSEALAAATAEYRRLSLDATEDRLAVSGEVNRMIAAAINADPR